MQMCVYFGIVILSDVFFSNSMKLSVYRAHKVFAYTQIYKDNLFLYLNMYAHTYLWFYVVVGVDTQPHKLLAKVSASLTLALAVNFPIWF